MAAKNDPNGLSRVSAKERTNHGPGPKVRTISGPAVSGIKSNRSNGGGINRATRDPR